MRLARPGIVGAAMLLALHVVMLAGVDSGHHWPVSVVVDLGQGPDVLAVARPSGGHSVAVACLAVLAGLLLWHVVAACTRRCCQPLTVKLPAAPVLTPPTPPPIALGVSRT